MTGWLKTPDGKPLGFQVTFFRSRPGVDQANPSAFAAKQLIIGHAAVSDPTIGHLLHDQRSARAGFGLAYARTGTTDVKLDDWTMVRGADGRYTVQVRSSQMTFDLVLAPTQPVLLEGDAGFSQKGQAIAHASYYYSEPQLAVTGKVARAGAAPQAVTGSAWLDHEWSSEALQADASGWDWIGANLADGGALMAFQVRNRQGSKIWAHATWRDRAGKVTQFGDDQVTFTPEQHWKSPRTEAVYPVATVLTTGALTVARDAAAAGPGTRFAPLDGRGLLGRRGDAGTRWRAGRPRLPRTDRLRPGHEAVAPRTRTKTQAKPR